MRNKQIKLTCFSETKIRIPNLFTLNESPVVTFPVMNRQRESLDGAVEDGERAVVAADHLTVDPDERGN